MFTLITIVLIGLGFAFIAVQNTTPSAFNFLGYSLAVPMYLIVFGSLLVGFLISWIVNGIDSIGTWSILRGKDKKIHESQETLAALQSRIRQLELENATLQGKKNNSPKEEAEEKHVLKEDKSHNFLDRFRKNQAY